jgi:hypothetical protein
MLEVNFVADKTAQVASQKSNRAVLRQLSMPELGTQSTAVSSEDLWLVLNTWRAINIDLVAFLPYTVDDLEWEPTQVFLSEPATVAREIL